MGVWHGTIRNILILAPMGAEARSTRIYNIMDTAPIIGRISRIHNRNDKRIAMRTRTRGRPDWSRGSILHL